MNSALHPSERDLPPPFPEWLLRIYPWMRQWDENPIFVAFYRRRCLHDISLKSRMAGNTASVPAKADRLRVIVLLVGLSIITLGVLYPFALMSLMFINSRGVYTSTRLPATLGRVISPRGHMAPAIVDIAMTGVGGRTLAEAYLLDMTQNIRRQWLWGGIVQWVAFMAVYTFLRNGTIDLYHLPTGMMVALMVAANWWVSMALGPVSVALRLLAPIQRHWADGRVLRVSLGLFGRFLRSTFLFVGIGLVLGALGFAASIWGLFQPGFWTPMGVHVTLWSLTPAYLLSLALMAHPARIRRRTVEVEKVLSESGTAWRTFCEEVLFADPAETK